MLSIASQAACAHERPKTVTSAAKAPASKRERTPSPPEWFWEPVEPEGWSGAHKPLELPIAEAAIARIEGASRVWQDLGDAGRERVRESGLVVRGSDAAPPAGREGLVTHMGAFYMDLREQRIPYVVTLDALAYVVHATMTRVLAEVEESLAPSLEALLAKLTARFDAEQSKVGVEVADGLKLARGVVAVAQALTTGKSRTPVDVAPTVDAELRNIEAHTAVAQSPLLGVMVDYTAFAAPSSAARPGPHRALTWLASVPLALVGKGEVPRAQAEVSAARRQTRAAMILARLVDTPDIHPSHALLARHLRFLYGPPDDLALSDVADAAAAIPVDLEKDVANVTKVDKLRKRAAALRQPAVADGWGAGANVRVFGGHAPPDSVALYALASEKRPLPSAIDVMAWLGAPEARPAVTDASYETTLAKLAGTRPKDDRWHASVFGSLLDAIATWVNGSRGAGTAADRMTLESALAAWTMARHDGVAMAQPKIVAHAPKELRVSGAPLAAFVETRPDVIAKLAGSLVQLERGLGRLGTLPASAPSRVTLADAIDLLRTALRIATKQCNDEALTDADVAALAALPARIASLEADASGEAGGHAAPMVTPMVSPLFVDPRGGKVLTSATGLVEPLVTVVREPATGKLVLAVGAHLAHHEMVEPIAQRSTDAVHLAKLKAVPPPPRAAYVSTFRVVR